MTRTARTATARRLAPVVAVALATAGLLLVTTAVPTSAGYVDQESASASAVTAQPSSYTPVAVNRTALTGAALSGGSVYLWGALGGGLAGNGKWNTANSGASDQLLTRVHLPITADPATTAPVPVRQLALNANQYATSEYSAGTTAAALTEAGDVYTWGTNNAGKLGAGNADTTAVCSRGLEANCSAGPVLSGVRTITASANAFYALTTAGDLYGWGTALFATSINASGQITTGEFGMDGTGKPIKTLTRPTLLKSEVAAVFASPHGRFDLSTANALTFSGYASSSMATSPASGSAPNVGSPVTGFAMPSVMAAVGSDPIVDLQAVPNNGMARTASGAVYTWGDGSAMLGRGQTSSGFWAPAKLALGPVKVLAVSSTHANIVLADGSVLGWGTAWASEGNTGSPGSAVAIPRLLNNALNASNPTPVGTDNVTIAVSLYSAFLVKTDGRMFGWGSIGGSTGKLLPGSVGRWEAAANVQKYIAPISRLTLPGLG